MAHAGESAQKPGQCRDIVPSSQENLPHLLIFVIFVFVFVIDLLVFLFEIVVDIVVVRAEPLKRGRRHGVTDFGPECETFAAAVSAASPDAAAAAGFCAVGAGVVAPGVAGGGAAGFAPGRAAYVVQK